MTTKQRNDAFAQKLLSLAKEQRELSAHGIFPDWLGPLNAAIARNALPFVLVVSLVISVVLFIAFFPVFFALGSTLI